MFSGIIESTGKVTELQTIGSNINISVEASFIDETYIDQSIAHNGICLTIIEKDQKQYVVTAIKESIDLTNLGKLEKGDLINLERCIKANDRMDGHFVQGHIDTTAICKGIESLDGSWYFTFEFDEKYAAMVVSKGSICVNGISLTVVTPTYNSFKVAIIPYTFEHTNFRNLKEGSIVNIEFDIIGKYIDRYLKLRK